MRFIADFHIHSRYSRATSKDMNLEGLSKWAKIKGISLLGTGDFTHPLWFQELKENLKEENYGIYSYNSTYFILTSEISFIYSQNKKLRRIHLIIFAPSLEIAFKINKILGKFSNLFGDGRPTIGKSMLEVLPLLWEISEDIHIVPAHAWTPWFSLFGSNSGFDSIEEAFGEYTDKIFAIETGLSSDPPMNWRLSSLDNISLISNSDAHSPSKIGREANMFDCDMNYKEIFDAIKSQDKNRFLFTIEFFPEEGKYHYDGHKDCNISLHPKESIKLKNICPVCKKTLTIGVLHRIEILADREEGFTPPNRIPYVNLVPLEEILAQAINKDPSSPYVQKEYMRLIENLGDELSILLYRNISDIAKVSERVAMGIKLMRDKKISIKPGYDGVYGKIEIFNNEERQISLF